MLRVPSTIQLGSGLGEKRFLGYQAQYCLRELLRVMSNDFRLTDEIPRDRLIPDFANNIYVR